MANNSPTGTGVVKNTPVYFELSDVGGSGIDQASLDVTIGGVAAITAGVFQAPFSGSIVANGSNGFDVTINKATDYGSYATISVVISVDDLEGQHAGFNWSFQIEDYLGPLVAPVSPTAGEPDVPLSANIQLRLQDENEVVLSTVRVYVDQGGGYELAFDGSVVPQFKPGWDGPLSSLTGPDNNRLIVIDKVGSLPPNTLITVKAIADDPDGNPERL
jgi:hypothetical protein